MMDWLDGKDVVARTNQATCLFDVNEAGDEIVLHWSDNWYALTVSDISAPEDLLWKIHHICLKDWPAMTPSRIAALVEAVARIKGWRMYGGVPHRNQMPPASIDAAAERAKLTPAMRYQVIRRDGHRCRCCGASVSAGATLHVDHIIPVSKGGVSTIDNLQTLCASCNQGKEG